MNCGIIRPLINVDINFNMSHLLKNTSLSKQYYYHFYEIVVLVLVI